MVTGKLRVGVIGVGHLGEYHVQKYQAIPTVDLVGVVDADPARASEIEERYHVKSYEGHNKILDEVDAVSLAVPTETHFNVARDVLSRGVHLLVEKPITYRLEDAEYLLGLAQENDLIHIKV